MTSTLYQFACQFEKMAQIKGPSDFSNMPSKQQLQSELPKETPSYPKIDPYIQMSLNNLGYKPAITVDGLLGPETQAALNQYRDAKKLPPAITDASVIAQIKNDAKSKGGSKVAFKVPGPQERAKGLVDLKNEGLDGTTPAGFVNPNSGNFTSQR